MSYKNGLVFNVYEHQLAARLQEEHPEISCNQQLMEMAYTLAKRYADDDVWDSGNSAWITELQELDDDDAFHHTFAALLFGRGYETPEAFWTDLVEKHKETLGDSVYKEFGIGYSVLKGYFVVLLASHAEDVARPDKWTCPPLTDATPFVPATGGGQLLRQVSIGAPHDILATDPGGATVRRFEACFAVPPASASSAKCASSHCCATWALGGAPARGAQHVSVSHDGTAYAAAPGRTGPPTLYKRDPRAPGQTGMSWSVVPGAMAKIAVGAQGVVYGISTVRNMYRLDNVTSTWIPLPGQWTHVAVGADGTTLAIDHHDGSLLRRANDGWQYLSGRFIHVDVGDRNNIWAIGQDYRVYMYLGDEQGWRRFDDHVVDPTSGQRAAQVAVGATSFEVWVIDTAGDAYRLARPDLVARMRQAQHGQTMPPPAPGSDDDKRHLTQAVDLGRRVEPDTDMLPSIATAETISSSSPESVRPLMSATAEIGPLTRSTPIVMRETSAATRCSW